MKSFLLALQFLTIIPVKIPSGELIPKEIGHSARLFVIVGLLQGIGAVAILAMGELIFHGELALLLGLLAYVLSNGGFHLDGLADTADAIAVRSSGDPRIDMERRLSVAKDSHTGVMGVVAVVFTILIKYLSLKNISNLIPSLYYIAFLLMPVVSKWTMTVAIFHGRPARNEGLGYLFIRNFTAKGYIISSLLLFIVYGIVDGLFHHYLPEMFFSFYISATGLLYLMTVVWLSFCNKRFGGQTGDTLGALSELTEMGFLLMLILWWRLMLCF